MKKILTFALLLLATSCVGAPYKYRYAPDYTNKSNGCNHKHPPYHYSYRRSR